MRQWKQAPNDVEFQSWREVAGFVDAEACFVAQRHSLELSLHQKHATSLEALQRFLLGKLNIEVRIYVHATFYFSLPIRHKGTQKVCEELLQVGLLLKRPQAELVLSHTPATHLEVSLKLQALKGNQGRFRRRDADGISRAAEIDRLRKRGSRLRRSSRIEHPEVAREVHELTERVDQLVEEHQRKELERDIFAMQACLEEVRRASEGVAAASELELRAATEEAHLGVH